MAKYTLPKRVTDFVISPDGLRIVYVNDLEKVDSSFGRMKWFALIVVKRTHLPLNFVQKLGRKYLPSNCAQNVVEKFNQVGECVPSVVRNFLQTMVRPLL